jgi:hypothetical protein
MTRYIVRVELHYATEAQYEKLHGLMAANAMVRYIIAAGGVLLCRKRNSQ